MRHDANKKRSLLQSQQLAAVSVASEHNKMCPPSPRWRTRQTKRAKIAQEETMDEATIRTDCKILPLCFASGEPPPEDGWAPLKTGGSHSKRVGPSMTRVPPPLDWCLPPRRLGPGRVGPLSRNSRRAGQNEVHALPSDDTRLFQSYDTMRYHSIATAPVTRHRGNQPTSNLANHQPVSQPIRNSAKHQPISQPIDQ